MLGFPKAWRATVGLLCQIQTCLTSTENHSMLETGHRRVLIPYFSGLKGNRRVKEQALLTSRSSIAGGGLLVLTFFKSWWEEKSCQSPERRGLREEPPAYPWTIGK